MPAAAVIRRVRGLLGINRRKARVGVYISNLCKYGITVLVQIILCKLRHEEVNGISSVGVISVDIRRNTRGEGDLPFMFDAEVRKRK